MGVGRFAFTPILPMMLQESSVSLAQGSWMATANYLGYLIGALACMWLNRTPAVMIRLGLAATALFTLAMALPLPVWLWVLLRGLAGVACALVFVYVSGWCMVRLARVPRLMGIVFTGPGIGIAATGFGASAMIAVGWQAAVAWLLFGLFAIGLTLLVWSTIVPADAAAVPAPSGHAAAAPSSRRRQWMRQEARILTVAYGLAGFGYIISATFLPVMARELLPAGSVWPDLLWPALGVAVAGGALLATRMSAEVDQRYWLIGCYLVQGLGVAMTVLWPTLSGVLAGSILIGLPFTMITLFAVREAHRLTAHLDEHAARRLVGLLTSAFSVGQIVGPPFAVAMTGIGAQGFRLPVLVASGALLLGAALYGLMQAGDRRQAAGLEQGGG